MLGNRIRGIVDNPYDLYAQALCRSEVNIVEPGAAQCDNMGSSTLQCLQNGGVGVIVDEYADCVMACRQANGLKVKWVYEIIQMVLLDDIGYIQEFAVVALGTEYGDFHQHSPR